MNSQDQERLTVLAEVYPQAYTTIGSFQLMTHVCRGFEVSKDLANILIQRGGIWTGKQRLFDPELMVDTGVVLNLHTPPSGIYHNPVVTPELILHEEETFLVFNKPPGWFCVGTPWDTLGTLEQALATYFKERDHKPPILHLVHRLDHQTSGLLIISKSARVNSAFQQNFNSGKVDKRYKALAQGQLSWETHTLLTGHSRGKNGIWQLYPSEMIGQPYGPNDRLVRDAKTTFQVRERFVEATEVEAELHTGRTHQIRLHLAHLGHPILGDIRYDGLETLGELQIEHQLLHAWQLSIPHPLSGFPIGWTAPTPDLWRKVKQQLTALS